MDQVPSDTDCWTGRHPGGSDLRFSDIRLALGSVNRLTSRFAAIYSTFKPNAGTIPDPHSRACTKGNTHSYADNDAVAKSSPYASASSDTSPPPPIALPNRLNAPTRQGSCCTRFAALDRNAVSNATEYAENRSRSHRDAILI